MNRWSKIPKPLRKPIESIISVLPLRRNLSESLSKAEEPLFERAYRQSRWLMLGNSKEKLYSRDFLNERFMEERFDPIGFHAGSCTDTDLFSRITYLQLKYDMSDLLLRDCDVMSMSHSLEVRLPFLDHRVVELALKIPQENKISGGVYKMILREAMRDLIPPEILKRPKQGFIFPLNLWLKKELRGIIDDTLSESSITRRGFFSWSIVKSIRRSFFSGRIPFFIPWNLAVLELWCRQFIDSRGFESPASREELLRCD